MKSNKYFNEECVSLILDRLNEGTTLKKLYLELRQNKLYNNSLMAFKKDLNTSFERTSEDKSSPWRCIYLEKPDSLMNALEKTNNMISKIEDIQIEDTEKESALENIDTLIEKLVKFRNQID